MQAGAALNQSIDTGLLSLTTLAGFYRLPCDYWRLVRELSLGHRPADSRDLLRAIKFLGLKGRHVQGLDANRLASLPTPAILRLNNGRCLVLAGQTPSVPKTGGPRFRVIEPVSGGANDFSTEQILASGPTEAFLVTRRRFAHEQEGQPFGLAWFLPSIWRYRQPLIHVVVASLFIQVLALIMPLFFQVVIDKVLAHHSYATLYVIASGLLLVHVFDVCLQQIRLYLLSHTTNRIDVELGRRLFEHLLKLPIDYFQKRGAGQTVARIRELETIRNFITGQALFSSLDLVFGIIFIAIMFAYSVPLTICVLASVPVYVLIGALVRPLLKERTNQRFNTGAANYQFLVETVVGIETIKASAVEPAMRSEWEESLAAYVRSSFEATNLGALTQNAVQFVSKITTTCILLFGAYAVMDGYMTVGALIAFNMIAGQAIQPILRLSQLWQDFQQVRISIERVGDVLDTKPERSQKYLGSMKRPSGRIAFQNVSFKYRDSQQNVLNNISIEFAPGEVVGIVGPSGSGKSTLTKLIQRFYEPDSGRIVIDGMDATTLDLSWLRSNIGVVLQDNLLFNRTVHDNIAFANPGLPRSHVVAMAQLTGADEFIVRLPYGYDTMIEERGANLSGGQRQRIAIARALATNPAILILDEATSALDYESERLIAKNMENIAKGRTVVIVAHRLAAVRRCDRIIGMRDGRIIEQGSHDQLLEQGGLYAQLWAMQSDMRAAV